MNVKFEHDIRRSLDTLLDIQDEKLTVNLSRIRNKALQRADSRSGLLSWSRWSRPQWSLPVSAAMTAGIMLIILFMPVDDDMQIAGQMAALPVDELEMLSTMGFDDLENIDFYNWLDIQEDLAG